MFGGQAYSTTSNHILTNLRPLHPESGQPIVVQHTMQCKGGRLHYSFIPPFMCHQLPKCWNISLPYLWIEYLKLMQCNGSALQTSQCWFSIQWNGGDVRIISLVFKIWEILEADGIGVGPGSECTRIRAYGGAAYNGGRAYYIIHYRAPSLCHRLSIKVIPFGVEIYFIYFCNKTKLK